MAAAMLAEDSGLDQRLREAEIILLNAISIDRTVLYRDDPELAATAETFFFERIRRRAAGEPVQYILGEIEFLISSHKGRSWSPNPKAGIRMLAGKFYFLVAKKSYKKSTPDN